MIYDIAGLRVLIKNRYSFTDRFCSGYLASGDDYDLIAEVTREEFEEEKKSSEGFSDGYVENICLYRSFCRQLPIHNRFLFHSCVVEADGKAVAFSGKSGAGKSTHSSLWLKYVDGAKILNGDKPIIGYDGKVFTAYGTPWNGKEGRGYNGSAPLKAIVFIEQAKENSITRLTVSEAASNAFSQILIPTDEENAAKTLELVDKFINTLPAFLLKCDISEEAVKVCLGAIGNL
ncbi:MAG: hypothetical protein IJS67_01005 [Clostridia bacterium]|nr:hypothetical protein [Clostridia bacterium]